MAYDGSVRIDTKLNSDGISKGVKASEAEVAKLTKSFDRANEKVAEQEKHLAALQSRYEEVSKIVNKTNMTAAEFQAIGGMAGFESAIKEFATLEAEIEKTKNALGKSKTEADALKAAMSNISGDGAKNIRGIGSSAEQTAAKANQLKSILAGIGTGAQKAASISVGAIKRIGIVLGTIAAGAARAAKSVFTLGKNLLTANKHAKTTSNGFVKLGIKMWSLIKAAFVFNVARKALSALKDSLGSVLMANKDFAASWNAIRVNLLTAFAPLWERIQPAIITFMDLLARFTSVLAQFMATLFGKTYQQAKASAKGIYDVATATDKAGKAAKKALAPFDELTILTKELGESDEAGLDFDAVQPDLSWADKFKERLAELTEEFGDYHFAIGYTIGETISEWLDNINWEEIKTKANDTASKIASIINGFVEGTNWITVGTTLGEGINTAVEFAETLFEKTDFYNIGESIATALNSTIDTINWTKLGEVAGNGINSVFETMRGFVDKFDFENLGLKLSEGLTAMTDTIQWEYIGETLGLGINGVLTTLYTFLTTYDFEKLGTQFASLLNKMITTTDWDLLGRTLGASFNSTINALHGFITEFDWANLGLGLSTAINGFFDEVDWAKAGETLSDGVLGAIELIRTAISGTDWKKIGESLAEFLANIDWLKIATEFTRLVGDAFDGLLSFLGGLLNLTDEVDWDGLKNSSTDLFDALANFEEKIGEGLKWFYDEVIVPLAKWALDNLIPHALDLVTSAIEALDTVIEAFKPFAIWLWEEFITPLGEWTGKIIIEAIKKVTEVFTKFSDWAKANPETFRTIAEVILGFLAGLWVYNTTKNMISFMTGLITKFIEFGGLQGMFSALAASINLPALAIGALMAAAVLWVSKWDEIKNSFNNMSTWQKAVAIILGVAAAVAVLITALTAGIAAAGILAGLAALGLGAGILALGNANANNQSSNINSTSQGTSQANAALSNLKIGGYSIPKLARGGIVDSATIAMIGEKGREAVVPLSQNAEWLNTLADKIAERSGQNIEKIEVTVKFTGDGAALAEMLAPKMIIAINGIATRSGQSQFKI